MPEMRRRPCLLLVQSAALALALSCNGLSESPHNVARDFWAAIQSRNLDAAEGLCTTANTRRLEALVRNRSIEAVSLGQTLKNQTTALVETSITSSKEAEPLSFNTHLTRTEGSWRVDLLETTRDLRRAAIAASAQEIEEALREGAEVLGDAIEQGAREASEALRQALEELEREFGADPFL